MMKIIRPISITDAMLTSSNVPETAPAAYAGGTTYAIDAEVSVAGAAGLLTVYRSLQNSNTGHTPASSPTWWLELGTTYQVWSSGSTYALGDRVIVTTGVHRIYEAIQGANTNHDPVADLLLATPLWWKLVTATDRWMMFDGLAGAQSSLPSPLTIVIQPGRYDSIGFTNIDAQSITVTMVDGVDTVYSHTVNLELDNVFNWYQYFYEPIIRKTEAVLSNIPVYGSATTTISFSSGSTVKCGEISFGIMREIGAMLYNAKVGIIDYSRKVIDEYGNPTIQQRRFSKLLTCDLLIDSYLTDEVHRLLTEYRSVPVVWAGSDEFASTIVFGFYRDFDVVIEGYTRSKCNLTVEGMT